MIRLVLVRSWRASDYQLPSNPPLTPTYDLTPIRGPPKALLAALPALNLNQSQLVTNAVLMAPVLMYHAFVPATNNASVPPGISYYNALK